MSVAANISIDFNFICYLPIYLYVKIIQIMCTLEDNCSLMKDKTEMNDLRQRIRLLYPRYIWKSRDALRSLQMNVFFESKDVQDV